MSKGTHSIYCMQDEIYFSLSGITDEEIAKAKESQKTPPSPSLFD